MYAKDVSESPSSSFSLLPLHFFVTHPQLREEFDRGVDVQLDEEHSVHDVAALLKEFLRDMPDPLLTKELYTAFINTACERPVTSTFLPPILFSHISFRYNLFFVPLCHNFSFTLIPFLICAAVLDSDEQQSVTQLLIYLLPACNSDTLHRLLEFLSTVADHAHGQQDKDGQKVRAKQEKKKVPNIALVSHANMSKQLVGSLLAFCFHLISWKLPQKSDRKHLVTLACIHNVQ